MSVGELTTFTNDITHMDYFIPIGEGTGASSFALMKKNGVMYAFGNENETKYTRETNQTAIMDAIGVATGPSSNTSVGSSGSPSPVLIIIGLVVGSIAVGVLLFWGLR